MAWNLKKSFTLEMKKRKQKARRVEALNALAEDSDALVSPEN